jgi:isoleucyl-tRNA synthetase
VRILAPVIPFTTDEAVSYAASGVEFAPGSVHLEDWPVAPDSWPDAESVSDTAAILKLRSKVNEAIEPLRAGGKIGKSLDAAVTLALPDSDPLREILARNAAALPEIFIVSDLNVGPLNRADNSVSMSDPVPSWGTPGARGAGAGSRPSRRLRWPTPAPGAPRRSGPNFSGS